MKGYIIEIKSTNNNSIVKFEANKFLVKQETYEFSNIDEASASPLAQKLFHLPFVKTVFIAQNFIGIEKYSIVEWQDVQDELAETIQSLLNEGTEVIKTKEAPKNIPVTVYAESTPNPGVMKFVANKKLVLRSTEFKNIDEAKNSPLAQSLFHFPFVKEVFLDENYVSVAKYDMADWNDITMELREFIRNYIQEGKDVLLEIEDASPASETKFNSSSPTVEHLDDISKEIVAILDEYVKPAVASDGGNIMFDSYDPKEKRVKVILQGACSGCPSSTFTLKNGIENMLRDMMHDKVQYVDAING